MRLLGGGASETLLHMKVFRLRPHNKPGSNQSLRQIVGTVLCISLIACTTQAQSLTESLKKGPVAAQTTEDVAVRDAAPSQGTFIIDSGKKLFELHAGTPVSITDQRELKTLFGPMTYVQITVKHPTTNVPVSGWAWYGDSKKPQFRLLP